MARNSVLSLPIVIGTACSAGAQDTASVPQNLERPPVTTSVSTIFNAELSGFIGTKIVVCTKDDKEVTVDLLPIGFKDHVADQTQKNRSAFQATMTKAIQKADLSLRAILENMMSDEISHFDGELLLPNPAYVMDIAREIEISGFPIPVQSVSIFPVDKKDNCALPLS